MALSAKRRRRLELLAKARSCADTSVIPKNVCHHSQSLSDVPLSSDAYGCWS